ncbi:2,3,4,5-tetrahydropyridine-2,6-carboxylate N-succinyltransferase [Oceanicola sp. D3]|uniref:Hint domain-containing protein n=1 Tax=Oceanicola sp. D3 TaxID=2587163 RepID=UPI00111CD439|nr:Hint domain-containing protein [Oceanicola sp. D3]QDC07767.1 2,3,4,5-tetrahydropyridine-2,6-carboxylate N-succinyltransferase [Oceanicola sp. D3]
MVAASELSINTNATATNMANTIFGDSVQVVSATYSGDDRSSGIYTGGNSTSPGVLPGDSGVILSTGRATDFTNSSGDANQDTNTSSNMNTGWFNSDPPDSDFEEIAGTRTYDASYLDATFIPEGDVMTIQFVFSSDEYPEYADSIYNDIVAVWVNGEYVELEVGSGDTSVINVNHADNSNLFIDNMGSVFNTEMDGFTVTMTLTMPVNAGEENTIRIGIADTSDSSYDSNLLIAADSVQTDLVAITDNLTMGTDFSKEFDLTGNDVSPTGATMTITHINGVAVTAGDSVTLGTGQTVTLNADGTITVDSDGDDEEVTFTYAISDGLGHTDTGFVKLDQVPCFVAGTMIATPDGEVPVESLLPGDMVLTHDDGPQPLRWIGRRAVPAEGAMAPIHIREGTFGQHRALTISPLHRLMIRDPLAELLFGDGEVLVAAKELVNGSSVTRLEGGEVEYVHLLFDRHQVVFSEGLPTESFLPGGQMQHSFEAEIVAEICEIFPELDPQTGEGYGPAARRMLSGYEARLWAAEALQAA